MRARMYAVRNSDGNSSGRASVFGVSDSFSGGVSGDSDDGGFINVGCMRAQIFFANSGAGILNNGFFVRMIMVVVAMYNGNAANTNIPNTKPGNPRSWACAKYCQWRDENMSKLNMPCSTIHIMAI